MEKKNITLELAGQKFQMNTTENPEYVLSLGEQVNARIKNIQETHPNMNLIKCVLLALLNAEDDLNKVREDYKNLDSKLTRLHEISQTSIPDYRQQHKSAYKKPVDV